MFTATLPHLWDVADDPPEYKVKIQHTFPFAQLIFKCFYPGLDRWLLGWGMLAIPEFSAKLE